MATVPFRDFEDARGEMDRVEMCVRGDVSVPDDLDRAFEIIEARGQGLDVIFANAGGSEFAPLGS